MIRHRPAAATPANLGLDAPSPIFPTEDVALNIGVLISSIERIERSEDWAICLGDLCRKEAAAIAAVSGLPTTRPLDLIAARFDPLERPEAFLQIALERSIERLATKRLPFSDDDADAILSPLRQDPFELLSRPLPVHPSDIQPQDVKSLRALYDATIDRLSPRRDDVTASLAMGPAREPDPIFPRSLTDALGMMADARRMLGVSLFLRTALNAPQGRAFKDEIDDGRRPHWADFLRLILAAASLTYERHCASIQFARAVRKAVGGERSSEQRAAVATQIAIARDIPFSALNAAVDANRDTVRAAIDAAERARLIRRRKRSGAMIILSS